MEAGQETIAAKVGEVSNAVAGMVNDSVALYGLLKRLNQVSATNVMAGSCFAAGSLIWLYGSTTGKQEDKTNQAMRCVLCESRAHAGSTI